MNQSNETENGVDYAIEPDLSGGNTYEREGKRYFVRLWPDPLFLCESKPGLWVETEDFEADFNMAVHRQELRRLAERYAASHPVWVRAILQDERVDDESSLPSPLRMMLRLRRCIASRERILEAIPTDVSRLVQRYPARHLSLLRFVARGPEAVQMVESHPLLAFLIATRDRVSGQPSSAFDRMTRELLRQKRPAILRRLGLPGSQSVVRTLSKVEALDCAPQTVAGLHEILADPSRAGRLRHLPRINAGVVAIVEDPVLLARVSDAFLQRLGCDAREDGRPGAARYLRRYLELTEDNPDAVRVFHSPDRLRQAVVRYADLLAPEEVEALNMRFPEPPLPDTPERQALRTPQDMADEADEQQNCLWNLIPTAAAGYIAYYRVLAPERATLSLRRRNGRWHIDAIEGPCNNPVSPETEDYVQRWLCSCSRD